MQLVKASSQIQILTAMPSSSGYSTPAPAVPSSRASVHSGDGDSASVRGGGSLGAAGDSFASEATREYLKNILLRYMSSSDAGVRAQMEAALAAIMEFTPAEISRVQVS